MKVLIVEDSKPISTMVGSMLEGNGYSFEVAENGKIGIEMLQKEKFDYVLLDWNMPVMNGEEFLIEVGKSSIPHGPILMMTTESKMEKISRAIELGAVEYIMKPFTVEVLIEKIELVKEAA